MFANLFHGQFPERFSLHPSWVDYLNKNEFDMFDKVVPCISTNDTEVDLTLPVQRYPLQLHASLQDAVLYEPVNEHLPASSYIVKFTTPENGAGAILHDYPIVHSFFAQRFDVIPEMQSNTAGLPMQQVKFVFYEQHPQWSKLVRYQIRLLAQLMNATFIPRPVRSGFKDVGYMLHFSKQSFCFDSDTHLPRKTGSYINIPLQKDRLQRDIELLDNYSPPVQRCIQANMLQATGMITIIDFTARHFRGKGGQTQTLQPSGKRSRSTKSGGGGKKSKKSKTPEVIDLSGGETVERICAICTLADRDHDGEAPTLCCTNARCSQTFHPGCMREWLLALRSSNSNRVVLAENSLIGACVYCYCPLIVSLSNG